LKKFNPKFKKKNKKMNLLRKKEVLEINFLITLLEILMLMNQKKKFNLKKLKKFNLKESKNLFSKKKEVFVINFLIINLEILRLIK